VGLGGIAAQDLFAHHDVDPGWLVGVRMAGGVCCDPCMA